jgi:hypothetical protein
MPKNTGTSASTSSNKGTTKQDKKSTNDSKSGKSTKEPAEKKSGKKELHEVVGFVFGGSIMKTSYIHVFAANHTNAKQHVLDTYSDVFGTAFGGRYVKCEDSEKTMADVLAQAEADGYIVEAGKNFLKCNVQNGSALLKNVTGCKAVSTIRLIEKEKKPRKGKAKKDEGDNEDADDDNEEEDASENGEEDDEADEDNDDADANDEDGEESEKEKETKPAKKSTQKKQAEKPAKAPAKGKSAKKGN